LKRGFLKRIVTTFERAVNYSLPQRRLVSFILVQADA
jgi:hypothetical protein